MILYSASNFCIKAVIYGLLFWLTDFLNNKGLYDYASSINIANEVGQFVGGCLLGYLNDRYNVSALFMPIFLLGSSIIYLLIKFTAGNNLILNFYYFKKIHR